MSESVRKSLNPGSLGFILSAYAGVDAPKHRLIWALDGRFGQLVTTTTEPMIGRIRLAWWNDALTDSNQLMGRGEPLVDELRRLKVVPLAGLTQWLDGWECLVGEMDLHGYAAGRGGGLFRALAGQEELPDWLTRAGAVWALWDLSGHCSEQRIAEEAVAFGQQYLLDKDPDWSVVPRPLRIAYQLARHDVERGRYAPVGLTPTRYLRLMRIGLVGR
ncbi:hypothetical protein [Sphingobium vermicomposti]|uniref:Phytoene synthase n=1 Tax=Sphingobium vermicomposti TaxID=529005 RepID=A0A846M3H2_9SPHN|nr:hypothetical protein [Sphingobium vermicomposti]NIJ16459.1 phytoene synthase [Sphingobium vermicomposti]